MTRSFASLEERHDAITRLCSERELDPTLVKALGGNSRWKTYRHMVRTRLSNMIESGFPRTTRALRTDVTERLVSDWFAGGGLSSPYIRDVVPSFYEAVDWPALSKEDLPWLADLARYELTLWQLRHVEMPEQPVEDFRFEGRPVINPATETLELTYPVFRRKLSEFEPEPKRALLFRHLVTDRVGYITLAAFEFSLFQRCREGERPMTECVQVAAKEHALAIDESLLEKVSAFLAELMSRTVLIGCHPAAEQ